MRSPVIIVIIHSGIAIPRFMESCVVGVNVYGNRPSRFIIKIEAINVVSVRAHLCPLVLIGSISCLVICFIIHC